MLLEDIVSLTNDQVAALSNAKVAELTNQHLNALTDSQVTAFTAGQVNALTNQQRVLLLPRLSNATLMAAMAMGFPQITAVEPLPTPAQLGGFGAASLATLTNQQMGELTDAHVQALTAAQAPHLSPQQLQAIPPAHIPSLAIPTVQALTPTQFAHLNEVQVQALTTAQLQGLGNSQLQALTTQQIAGLLPTQLQQLSPAQINALTLAQVGALTPSQINSLTAIQVAALSPAQTAVLALPVSSPLSPALNLVGMALPVILAVPVGQIPNVPIAQFPLLTAAQLAALTNSQVQALTPAQLQSLAIGQLDGWLDDKVQQLLPDQLARLRVAQVNAVIGRLMPAQIPAITPMQMQAVPRHRFQPASFENARLQALTRFQFAALLLSQVHGITFNRINNLTDAQVGWLVPRMPSADVNALSPPAHAPPGVSTVSNIPSGLQAALPTPLTISYGGVIPQSSPLARIADRRAMLLATLPDMRASALVGYNFMAGLTPNGTQIAALNTLLAAVGAPKFAVQPNGSVIPGAMARLFTITPLELAQHVANVLGGAPSNLLEPWFRGNRNWNNLGGHLPGAAGPVGSVAPYREFDIYPNPHIVGAGVNRGTHRLVIGVPAVVGHSRRFYTSDHYRTFLEI